MTDDVLEVVLDPGRHEAEHDLECPRPAHESGEAHRASVARADSKLEGMGTTLVAALVTYVGLWATYGFRYSAARDPSHTAWAESALGLDEHPPTPRVPEV